jgi:hypothetical protein
MGMQHKSWWRVRGGRFRYYEDWKSPDTLKRLKDGFLKTHRNWNFCESPHYKITLGVSVEKSGGMIKMKNLNPTAVSSKFAQGGMSDE